MCCASSKMQQRAAILNILKKYLEENDKSGFRNDIEALCTLEDRDYTIRVLMKELTSDNEFYSNACTAMVLELSDTETFQKYALEIIKDKNVPDKKKFFLISILKQKGIHIAKEDIEAYINHPDSYAHGGIKDFLKDALSDAEVQIDLLDFYTNISYEERNYLLNNLRDEFQGDDLANAFSLISYLNINKNELECVLDTLLESDSPYAIEGLENILESYDLISKTRSAIRKKIKELKLKGNNDVNAELIKNSKIYKCLVSFADGSDSF